MRAFVHLEQNLARSDQAKLASAIDLPPEERSSEDLP